MAESFALILLRNRVRQLEANQSAMKINKLKVTIISVTAVLAVFLVFLFYQMAQSSSTSSLTTLLMLIIGLALGGGIAYLATRNSASAAVITESSHTIAESMRKVFKIVSAEGHFNEIYNYEETTKLLKFFPSKKKALVIVQAKVLVGYDFDKLKWELDEENRRVRLLEFPAPEILSTETDYKYYNIEEQFFNLFSKEDLAKIQQNGKRQVIEAAQKSNLPNIAAEQMRTLLTELLAGRNFSLENPVKISESRKLLNDYSTKN